MEPPVISLEPKVRKMRWAKLTAAAVIVGAFAMGTYFYLTSRPSQTIAIVQPKQNDIAPPSVNKSILTLDDRTKIELDSTGNGTLATQGNVKIIKHSTGEISYAGTAEGVISYNTLSVPRGSKPLSLLLSDGSKVWINVGSSLRYPTAFKGSDKDKKGTTHRGYFWVYHNSIDGLVWFDYQEGRGREGPVEVLKDFKGYLQTDGYAVYDFFKEERDITVLHCMAHARRMFFEARDNDKVVAEYALEQIRLLYNIERKVKEQQLDVEQILQLRQTEAAPVLVSLGKWMKETYLKVLPKSAIGKALGYSIARWAELMLYATDGKLNIDNNPVENSIRPVAIGRKNYLFADSHEAAKRSAMLYSLMGTCKLHGINPFIWLRDVLQRIATHSINKIEDLLPHNWQPTAKG